MKKQYVAAGIVILLIGFSAQKIIAQVNHSNSLSQWADKHHHLVTAFANEGDVQEIEGLKSRVIELIKMRAELSNVDAETAGRSDIRTSSQIAERIKQMVSKVWAAERVDERVKTMVSAWDYAKSVPNYMPFENADYLLDSWQGITISDSGQNAYVVVTGQVQMKYKDHVVSDSLEQSQIELVKQKGVWLFDSTVVVVTGD